MAKGFAASFCAKRDSSSSQTELSNKISINNRTLTSGSWPKSAKTKRQDERRYYANPVRLTSWQNINRETNICKTQNNSYVHQAESLTSRLTACQSIATRRGPCQDRYLQRFMDQGSRFIGPRGRGSGQRIGLVLALVFAIVTQTKYCSCDRTSIADSSMPTAQAPSVSSTSALVSSIVQASKINDGSSDQKQATTMKLKSPIDNHQKHNLLSSLADQIERQHFKLRPSLPKLSIGYQGSSSKYDSDFSYSLPIDFKLKDKQSEKADDSIRKIMAMHENGIKASAHSTPSAGSSSSLNFTTNLLSQTGLSSLRKLRKLSASSLPTIVGLEPAKVASRVLAYVSPLMVAKLSESSGSGAGLNVVPSSLRRPRLHSFKPRSLAGSNMTTILLSGLFGPGSRVTGLPQTSSLAKPQSSDQVASTPASIISKASSFNDAALNDLLAESSELLSETIPMGPQYDADKQPSDKSPVSSQMKVRAPVSGESEANSPVVSSGGSKARPFIRPGIYMGPNSSVASKLKQTANQVAQTYFKKSFRDLITLSQLPILSTAPSTSSTAPSVLETKRPTARRRLNQPTEGSGKPTKLSYSDQRQSFIDELYRYVYLLGTGVRNKRDPLEALGSSSKPKLSHYFSKQNFKGAIKQRSVNHLMASASQDQLLGYASKIRDLLLSGPMNKARPRGVMWDMATDPSLAVTVFHLLERASVALPLGFLLIPFVKMIRHPLNGINLGRILPAKATHRSIDIEELAKRLDSVDKMLSRALRSAHRQSLIG